MNSYSIGAYQCQATIHIDYGDIDIDQVVRDEMDMHTGKRDTPELRAEIVANLVAKLQPEITIGPWQIPVGAHS